MNEQKYGLAMTPEAKNTLNTLAPQPRPIYEIVNDIHRDWKNIHYAAAPYLHAMGWLNQITDYYGLDDARSIVLYFLSNASSWHGPGAKAIKAELKAMLKEKK